MKFNRIIFATVAGVLALASCSKVKNEITTSEYDPSKTPVASLTYIEEGSSDTKAVFEIDGVEAIKAGATSFTILLATSMDDEKLGNGAFFKNIDAAGEEPFQITLSSITGTDGKKLSLAKGDLYIPMIRANYPPFIHSDWTKVYAAGSDRLALEVGYGMKAVTFEKPAGVSCTATDETIDVTWRRVPYAQAYTVEFREGNKAEWNVIDGIKADKNSYTIGGLNYFTPYEVRVKAVNRDDETEYAESSIVTEKTYKLRTKDMVIEFFTERAAIAGANDEFKLMNDIDMEGYVIPQVATYVGGFNGQGFALKNFKTTTPIFGEVSGYVKNIILEGNPIEANEANIAVLAAVNSGSLENVVNKTNVTVTIPAGTTVANPVAGIVLKSTGSISECVNEGNISVSSTELVTAPVIAGIVALQSSEKAKFKGNVNKGDISLVYPANQNGALAGTFNNVKPFTVTAGVVGIDEFTVIEECVNEGKVFASCTDDSKMGARQYIGGVVGEVFKTDVNKCVNRGAVTADFVNRTAATNGKQIWIGGICGGRNSDYDSKTYGCDGANFNDCENYGEITLDCVEAQNHYLGGIAGQATIESPAKSKIPADPGADSKFTGRVFVGCNNYGKLVKKGPGQSRLGGIQAGAATLTSCNNYGEIVIEDCNAASAIGGLIGYPTQAAHPVNNCGNYGNITTYSTNAHTIGGIFGQHGNTTVTHGTVNVDCKITASSAQAVGFVFAANSGYKAATTIGSEGAPCKVKGSIVIDGTETKITSENLNQYIVALMNTGNVPVVNNVATISSGSVTIYAVCE